MMKVAIIGCGKIAKGKHIPLFHANPNVEIKYLVDPAAEQTRALAREYSIKYVLSDYTDILHDEEITAVSICTPTVSHSKIAVDFLNAGKHVLCEKPIAADYTAAKEMQAAANRNGKILNIALCNRFHTAVNHIRDLIAAGELGNVYHVYCSFRNHRSIPGLGGAFTTKAASGGGVLLDWGVHFLDLILYCIGSPKLCTVSGQVYGEIGKDISSYVYEHMWAGPPNMQGIFDVEDMATGLIRTEGPTISLNGSWAENIGEDAAFIDFLGDKAGIKFRYGGDFTLYYTKNNMLCKTTPVYRKENPFQREIDDFIECVLTGKKNRQHIDHVISVAKLIEGLYRSAKEGKEIKL